MLIKKSNLKGHTALVWFIHSLESNKIKTIKSSPVASLQEITDGPAWIELKQDMQSLGLLDYNTSAYD